MKFPKGQQMKVPEKSDESLLNRAYGCFAFVGLAALPYGLAGLLSELGLMNFHIGSGGAEENLTVVGIVLGVPIFVGILTASVWGIRETVRFRHPALVVLSTISIVCGYGSLALLTTRNGDRGHPLLDSVTDIGVGIYIAVNILIPAWWFAMGRRRY
ncbi:MAG TPA: hypothetical protein VNX26_16290 [Candidatus Acidoferrum sp.]|nr:hypothetical protein [Candidatus Acidoferrum sp.]